MTSYLLISLVLDKPERGLFTDMPTSKAEWKRFFGMMDTLERAEIAEYRGGRYLLHPKRKADVVANAEAVLTEISKPLTLPEPVESPVVAAPVPAMPEFNGCPRCQGKGRVNIEDELGFFGNFLCLTCYGKGQIPVPPRSTFPPVDVSKKPEPPNAVLFSDNPKPVAAIPQVLEVSGVRVIVEASAPVLSMPSITVEEAAEGLVGIAETVAPIEALSDEDTQLLSELITADRPTCAGSGMIFDTLSEAPYIRVRGCDDCGGTGELQELPLMDVFPDSPQDELPSFEPINEMGDGGFVWHNRVETPAQTIPEILATIQEYNQSLIELERISDKELRSGIQKNRVVLKSFTKNPLPVRVNWTSRGLSSGVFELLGVIRQYGKIWYMVKVETDKVYRCPVLPELCELVIMPLPAPKAIEVITPQANLLEGREFEADTEMAVC
jgi:hypothetical protein